MARYLTQKPAVDLVSDQSGIKGNKSFANTITGNKIIANSESDDGNTYSLLAGDFNQIPLTTIFTKSGINNRYSPEIQVGGNLSSFGIRNAQNIYSNATSGNRLNITGNISGIYSDCKVQSNFLDLEQVNGIYTISGAAGNLPDATINWISGIRAYGGSNSNVVCNNAASGYFERPQSGVNRYGIFVEKPIFGLGENISIKALGEINTDENVVCDNLIGNNLLVGNPNESASIFNRIQNDILLESGDASSPWNFYVNTINTVRNKTLGNPVGARFLYRYTHDPASTSGNIAGGSDGLIGLYSRVEVFNPNNLSNNHSKIVGIHADVNTQKNTNGTIQTVIGLEIDQMAGECENAYGLLVGNVAVGEVSNYGIYIENTSQAVSNESFGLRSESAIKCDREIISDDFVTAPYLIATGTSTEKVLELNNTGVYLAPSESFGGKVNGDIFFKQDTNRNNHLREILSRDSTGWLSTIHKISIPLPTSITTSITDDIPIPINPADNSFRIRRLSIFATVAAPGLSTTNFWRIRIRNEVNTVIEIMDFQSDQFNEPNIVQGALKRSWDMDQTCNFDGSGFYHITIETVGSPPALSYPAISIEYVSQYGS